MYTHQGSLHQKRNGRNQLSFFQRRQRERKKTYEVSPEKRLPRPGSFKYLIDIIKIGEIRVYLKNIIWLCKSNRSDIKKTRFPSEEWAILHPRNNVVQTPRDIETDGRGREIPSIDRFVGEDERPMAHTKDELAKISTYVQLIFIFNQRGN